MDDKEIATMTGQAGGERTVAYKLNEVRMSGDTGKFSVRELLSEKDAEGHYPVIEIGEKFQGVILKMRWRLSRYDEKTEKTTTTSEYDNKNTDKVVVFGSNEKGFAFDMKEKYDLGSQRVLYVYLPARKEIARLIIKASALSGEKNPNKELGLFEYVDTFNVKTGPYMHNFLTTFYSVYREDDKNKRKSYWATAFALGDGLTDSAREKVIEMVQEVHDKTTATNFTEEYVPSQTEPVDDTGEVDPADIPF